MDTNTESLPAMKVISLTNFENFLGGYLTATEVRECVFIIPQKYATSPEKELVKAGDLIRVIQKDY